jgi:hypothetical protein
MVELNEKAVLAGFRGRAGVDIVENSFSLAAAFHELPGSEQAQMVADGGLGQGQILTEFADVLFAGQKQTYDVQAGGVG